jgi:hypothetical protein
VYIPYCVAAYTIDVCIMQATEIVSKAVAGSQSDEAFNVAVKDSE